MAALTGQVSETTSSVDWSDDDDDDDIELDYYGDDIMDTPEPLDNDPKTDPEWYPFECMDPIQVQSFVDAQLQILSSKHLLDSNSALYVLQYCNWNSQQLETQLLKKKLADLLQELHVVSTNMEPVNNSTCAVCFDNLDNNYKQLTCRHCFCTNCLELYLMHQITNEGKSLGIECMICDTIISEDLIQRMLHSETQTFSRYLSLKRNEIIMSHHMLRVCPGVNCTITFHAETPMAKRVTCSSCGTSICFLCSEEYHCPTECEPFRKWLLKCHDDSETFNYISVNTKDCPKCKTSIEKNGGCNHINCTKCRHDFCWMCLEDWSKHCGEYYECSRYKLNPEKYKDKSSRERSALQKYLFYYERWKNHDQSLLLEEQTRKTITNHIETKVNNNDGTWIDWQYLLDAASLLKKCRYTLKYTYPRAFWMEGDRKQLFEYQQAQLELEIENLSWKIERANMTDRAELETQMNVTEIRRTTLLRDFII